MKNRLKVHFIYLSLIATFLVSPTQYLCGVAVNHSERLNLLKSKGFNPKVIYDIGAWRGEWAVSIKNIFPNTQFFLFEANENQVPFLSSRPYPYFIALLGNEDKIIEFYTNDSTGDSIYQEQTRHYQGENYKVKQLRMRTLASVVSENKLPLPDLVKLDVQGAEKIIIKGSPEIITHAEVVIMEAKILEYNKNSPLIFELMTLMYELGYSLIDIVEFHYLPTGELNEIDLLFVKNDSKLIKKGVLVQ